MSDLKQAAQQALEAWDRSRQWPFPIRPDKEFDALRAALAQPIISPEIKGNKAEPVAGMYDYTHPPQRKPLTDAEMDKLFGYETERGVVPGHLAVAFVRIVERAHGIGS
jgi:hypothetical protein